jgi:hypothetical protein
VDVNCSTLESLLECRKGKIVAVDFVSIELEFWGWLIRPCLQIGAIEGGDEEVEMLTLERAEGFLDLDNLLVAELEDKGILFRGAGKVGPSPGPWLAGHPGRQASKIVRGTHLPVRMHSTVIT